MVAIHFFKIEDTTTFTGKDDYFTDFLDFWFGNSLKIPAANNFIYRGNNYNSFGYGTGRQNYGYYGSGVFSNHYRTTGGLFGGGKRSFALGAGTVLKIYTN